MSQRPRNRQSRPPRNDNHRARGRGGRIAHAGDRGEYNNDTRSRAGGVPTIQQVISGAAVSIVLKIDQPTGRQVQGIVGEVLTHGNHPRGIKVRLRDGRVGRVQKMVSQEEAQAASEGLCNLGRNGETLGENGEYPQPTSSRGSRGILYSDLRHDEFYLENSVAIPSLGRSLGDFFPSTDNQQDSYEGNSNPSPLGTTDFSSTMSTCPVCGEFQGDETAVSHHVNSHFE
ncbi:MAG: hypothetical protein M1834_005056 [Cirrosporium novae-zelandiae]|nr:MAG: hypothetical protein M1834_005056 [Cirrosporium novae-zelandiae]